jgi:hypothetical protein
MAIRCPNMTKCVLRAYNSGKKMQRCIMLYRISFTAFRCFLTTNERQANLIMHTNVHLHDEKNVFCRLPAVGITRVRLDNYVAKK